MRGLLVSNNVGISAWERRLHLSVCNGWRISRGRAGPESRSRRITCFHWTVTNCCIAQSNAALHISGASGVAEVEMENENEDHIARGDGPPGHVAGFCSIV